MQRAARIIIAILIALILFLRDEVGTAPMPKKNKLQQISILYNSINDINDQNINYDVAAEILLSLLQTKGIVPVNDE
ncbi:MAG: hypothetical protein Q7J85_09140 [Bacillota bacterium]|nr:hypothetical protein [Bacillota bacterium]